VVKEMMKLTLGGGSQQFRLFRADGEEAQGVFQDLAKQASNAGTASRIVEPILVQVLRRAPVMLVA
jgi:hypothetical protein